MRSTIALAGVLTLLCAACSRESSAPAPATPAAPALAAVPNTPDSASIAIQCGRLIDGVAAEPAGNSTVVVRNGRIEAVNAGFESPPQGLAVLDLREYTCLPGLIDMHTHVTETSEDMTDMGIYVRRTDAEQEAISTRQAGATLLAGFTTIRNVGSYKGWTDRTLSQEIDAGKIAGPRMQFAGFYLTIPQGGGDLIVPGKKPEEIPAEFHTGVARTPEEFARKAQAAVDGGAGVLKIIASGAVLAYGGVPGAPEVDELSIKAIVDVAHAAGRKVTAHAHGALSIKQAIRAGVDSIEHASLIDDEAIQMARDKKVALSMDIYNGDYIDTEGRKQKWAEEFLRKNLETTQAQREGFTKAHAAGVPIVYGTDAGVYPHGLNARQFPIMVQRGMSPMEAIQSATSVAAHYLGWDDRVGAIAPGRFGDLIAVKEDPLQDITRLQDVAVVVKGGLLFKMPGR